MYVPENITISKHAGFRGKNISILGMARSGIAAARLLKKKEAVVFISDSAAGGRLQDEQTILRELKIGYEVGGHTERIYDADLIVVSPGVHSDSAVIKSAQAKGIKIISELELASRFCVGPVIAVTGTNGKTTTTTLIGRLFENAGLDQHVGGNIGNAFSSFAEDVKSGCYAVLEVSSFQLDHIESFRPHVSIILNITPDHLDRYEHDFNKYIFSKFKIIENQTAEDYLIYNYDDEVTREHISGIRDLRVKLVPFSVKQQLTEGAFLEGKKVVCRLNNASDAIIESDRIGIPGIHNLYNSMAAVLAARICGIDAKPIRATLENFKGVEHRLEFVRELDGVVYINDSKATNVDSVWYALQAYAAPIILLLGGRDKGNDYDKLRNVVAKHVKAIIAIGESADKVYGAFHSLKHVERAGTMSEAVSKARNMALPGEIVLLSPACASFDWFKNYEHRGEIFKQIVNSL